MTEREGGANIFKFVAVAAGMLLLMLAVTLEAQPPRDSAKGLKSQIKAAGTGRGNLVQSSLALYLDRVKAESARVRLVEKARVF